MARRALLVRLGDSVRRSSWRSRGCLVSLVGQRQERTGITKSGLQRSITVVGAEGVEVIRAGLLAQAKPRPRRLSRSHNRVEEVHGVGRRSEPPFDPVTVCVVDTNFEAQERGSLHAAGVALDSGNRILN